MQMRYDVSTTAFRRFTSEQSRQCSMVLLTVLSTKGSTRADLIEATGLTRSIVTDRVADLLELGVLGAGSATRATGGRSAAMLTISPTWGHLVVAVMGFSHLRVAITTTSGEVVSDHGEAVDMSAGPAAVTARILELYLKLLETAQPTGPLRASCVALPTPVANPGGIVVSSPDLPSWNGFETNAALDALLGAPCWTDNDVNLIALGERQIRGDAPADVLLLKVGTGLGAGIISDGRLLRGADGSAGDIGHNPVPGSSVPCICGQTGCLGVTAGTRAWVRGGTDIAEQHPESALGHRLAKNGRLDAGDVVAAADAGDAHAVTILRNAGMAVGETVASLVNTLNPRELIVNTEATDGFMAALRQSVYARALPISTRRLVISRSVSPADAGVVGAVVNALTGTFEATRIATW